MATTMSGQCNYAYEDSGEGTSDDYRAKGQKCVEAISQTKHDVQKEVSSFTLIADLNTLKSYGSTQFEIERESSSTDGKDEDQARQKWGSPVEFLLSCIAMSVISHVLGFQLF